MWPIQPSDAELKAEVLRRFTAGEIMKIFADKVASLPNKSRHWLLTTLVNSYQENARELGDFEQRRKSATQKG